MAKNNKKVPLKGTEILCKKTLILGEAGSGKTKLAAKLLQELMTLVNPEEITVIDLAPKRIEQIGGKMTEYVNIKRGVKCFSPRTVYTPRLAGNSAEQVLNYAELNRKSMEPLLDGFVRNTTKALVLNDVTLYLHLGRLENVLKCVRLAETFLGTAYYGSRFEKDLGTGISSRERQLTDKLVAFMDSVVKID